VRKIDVQEMIQFLGNYLGKQIEVGTNPLWTVSTYQSFRWNDSEDTLTLYDGGNNSIRTRQEILVDKDQIVEIMLTEGEDIYGSVISIELQNHKIDFCISSMPIRCFKCRKIIDEPYETKWSIRGIGGYGSKFDNEKLDIPICDSCLYYKILGYKDGVDCE